MKKTILIAFMIICALLVQAGPFDGNTKHHPVKRMKVWQVRNAQKGIPMYYRYRGTLIKTPSNVKNATSSYWEDCAKARKSKLFKK